MRLLIVDDHEFVRRGVRALLQEKVLCEVCGEAVDGCDAMEKARDLNPDVIVMDVSMPRLNGLEATRQIRALLPQCQVVVLSQHESLEMARQALKAGARGYVVKSSIAKDLVSAVVKAANGEYYFDPAILERNASNLDVQEILQRSLALEKALRESEQLYRSAFEQTGIGISHVAPDGRWLRVNRKICDIVGYSEEELLQLTFQEITHPEDLPADLALTAKLVNGEMPSFSMEKRYIRKDGSPVWVNLTVSAARDRAGKLKHFITVVEDISGRRKAEDALRQSEQRLQLAQQVANVGTFDLNMKTGVNRWTPELERLYGLEPGSFAGTQPAWEQLVYPEDRDQIMREVEHTIKDKIGSFEGQWRVRWPDGSIHWLLGRAWVVRDREGTPERLIGVNVDITERKRMEDALEESRNQLLVALESSKIAMFDWDVVRRRGQWNPQMAALYDFQPSTESITAEEYQGLFHSEDRERLAQEAERLWRGTEERFSFEFRAVRRDREIRWMLSQGRVVRDASGKALHMIGTHSDITDRKLTESATNLLASIVASSDDAIVSKTLDGVITSWNKGAERIFGYTADEAIGQPITLVIPEDRLSEEVEILARLRRGEKIEHFHTLRRRKDGTLFDISVTISPVRDSTGRVIGASKVARDITAQKRAEQALRESEQRYQAVTDTSPVMIWMAGTDKLCFYFNKGWLDFVGRTLDQEAGNGWAANVHPDDFDRCLQVYNNSFDARLSFEMEYRLRHHSGDYRWIFDRGMPRYAADGSFEGYIGGCLDIHDQKQAAEKVRLADETLRLMKIQDKERRRIARELHDSAGQTLAVLGMSLAQLVQDAEPIAPELAKQGKEIEEVVRQLSREIRTTSYLLHPPLLDETGLPSALSWYVQGVAERSGMAIDLSIPDDFGRLPGDMELAIFRVVQECLTNIHRHAESKTAYIRVGRQNECVSIEVRDQGKGMSPQRLAEIQSRALGVGISGIKERLRQFHGEMKIESSDSGTIVNARLAIPKDDVFSEFEPLQAAV